MPREEQKPETYGPPKRTSVPDRAWAAANLAEEFARLGTMAELEI